MKCHPLIVSLSILFVLVLLERADCRNLDSEIARLKQRLDERTKPVSFRAFRESFGEDIIKDWITFEKLSELRGGGFDKSSGTYTVPEDGIYIFGLKATSGSQLAWTQIDFYKNNALDQTVVTDVNDKDNFNNLGTTWIDTLKKGDEVRLKVGLGSVNGYLAWWGVRIFAD